MVASVRVSLLGAAVAGLLLGLTGCGSSGASGELFLTSDGGTTWRQVSF